MNLKELIKKHFNLVEAPVELQFGEIKSKDGELTLTYEGDEFTVGTAIFVKTEEGDVPAPDGEHMLEGDIKITTVDGKITEIEREEMPEAEVETDEVGDVAFEEAMPTPTMEEMITALAEVMKPYMDQMKKDMEEMKAKFASMDKKVETFSNAPAAIRAKEEIYAKRKATKTDDFRNDEQRKVFERIVNRKLKK